MKHLLPIFALFILCVGCTTQPQTLSAPDPSTYTGRKTDIHVVSHGKHTGLILPASFMFKRAPTLEERFAGKRWLEIGWGDAGFYQAEKITTRLTLHAVFWPTKSVVHIVGFTSPPTRYFAQSEVQTRAVDEVQVVRIVEFVSNSLARDKAEALIKLREGIYGDSQFYRGIGRYHLFNTCNKWTAKALKSGGIPIGVTSKITSGQVMRPVRKVSEN